MLTVPAFNALLKTLEEPPEHVKFIFCTTDPERIPVTVLSRCQRFDFAPVGTDSIVDRLRFIVDSEGINAEEAALGLLARRAAGSMRDSQSLLEQLLSFCGEKISEDDVHAMLGTAQSGRLSSITERLVARDAPGALAELDSAVSDGVDVGQLAEQLVGYFRDMMAAVVGCPADLMLHTASADQEGLKEAGTKLGLETILASIQILDQAVARMRQSPHVRTLVEIALVRVCNLDDLDELPQLIAQLRQGAGEMPTSKGVSAGSAHVPSVSGRSAEKKTELASEGPETRKPAETATQPDETTVAPLELTAQSAERTWRQALADIGGVTADMGGNFESLAISAPNSLVVNLKGAYNKEWCERQDVKRKIEEAMSRLTGQAIRVSFTAPHEDPPQRTDRRQMAQARWQKMREVEQNPLVQEVVQLFDAEVTGVDEKRKE
jgi:DNA polymerase-3 subunit gamma/tau